MKLRYLWEDTSSPAKPKVLLHPSGGLVYQYTPFKHVGDGRCMFTLWAEVGEMYRAYFDDFWKTNKLSNKLISIQQAPYIFDQLENLTLSPPRVNL